MRQFEKKSSQEHYLPHGPAFESVRVGTVSAIPALLEQYANQPVEQILAEAGVDLELFENPDNSISFDSVGRLLDLSAKKTGIPHFGLLVAENAETRTLGDLIELATYAPNAGSALYSMIVHVCINDRGGVPTLHVNNGIARLGYAIYVPVQKGIRLVYSASLAIICNIMRALCGESWAPSEVLFSHSRPADIKPYETFFQAPLIFEADEDALVFPEHWLFHALPNPDKSQHDMTVDRLNTIEAGMGIDLLEEMRSVIRPLIVSQSCKIEQVAGILSMHPRTLNRRLKELNTSFREIIGEMRYEIAKQMLRDEGISILKISNTLSYSDPSEFTRAFKRWSGMTPSAWRMQSRQ
jgi:AraC-like DNA-binding protein